VRRVGRRPIGDDVLDPEMAVAVGDTLELAIKGALDVLGAREDEVDVEILEEGRRGFLGLGRLRPYRVRVTWREDDEETIEEELTEEESEVRRRAESSLRRKRGDEAARAPEPRTRELRPTRTAGRESTARVRADRDQRAEPIEPVERAQRSEPSGRREDRPRGRGERSRRSSAPARAELEERPARARPAPIVERREERPLAPRQPSYDEPRPPAARPVDDQPLLERARIAAEQILGDMGMEVRVVAREVDGDVWVDVESDVDDALLIGRRGETRNAIQYIVQRVLGPRAEAAGSVIVDVNGFWERRMAHLAEESRALADQVAADGREMRTEPLTAQERRVVHRALADDGRVRTESHGEGDVKRVSILPSSAR
jgi:spoIIIJ-associated protein